MTFSGIEYTNALSNFEIDDDTYFYEMGYQDEDSADRDDLELVAEGQVVVEKEMIQLLVLMDDITSAKVETYNIEMIDDDDDEDDDLFNLRFLNLHPDSSLSLIHI